MTLVMTIFVVIIIIIRFFKAHQHKAAGRKTRLDIQNYGCNRNLLGYHGVVERNRTSCLQSHGKALEKECCLPGLFCDSGDTPANLLCELNGHLMPCTRCFYGKWVEDVYVCRPIWSICLSCYYYYYYFFIIIIIFLPSVDMFPREFKN